MTSARRTVVACVVAVATALPAMAATPPSDPLRAGFADPPNSARPRVWWHWMNGNVSKDGIEKDLAWMKSAGIGGLQNFDASLATPQVVGRRLVYMTPEWKDAFRHATMLAERHGLELAIAASPGWSETGGPWVPPQDGIKKLVWSEVVVEGGRRAAIRLPKPPDVTGPFQDLELFDELAGLEAKPAAELPRHSADVAVLAMPAGDVSEGEMPVASVAGRALDGAVLGDRRLAATVEVPRDGAPQPVTIDLRYRAPRRVRSATIYVPGAASMFADPSILPVLEVRDGEAWREVARLPLSQVPTTVSFAPVTAREFRVLLAPNREARRVGVGEGAPGVVPFGPFAAPPPGPPPPLPIAELRLEDVPRVDRFELKAGFAIAPDYYALGSGPDDGLRGVVPGEVRDLASRLRPDGTLDWVPPPGRWRVMRLGWSLTGKTNHPATPEATGLEVDKLDGAAVRRYLEHYLGLYRDTLGRESMGARGLRALLTDSIEVGAANWTPALREQFRRLRGYDPLPWLPTLTGIVVGSRRQSDAFLYDFRRTLAELLASEHYGTVAAVAHENGLTVYGEALEDRRPSLGDDLAMRAHADVPMAALWAWSRGGAPRSTLLGDMKGASSVANVHGQNLAAAESMTSFLSPWAHAPADLRRVVDLEFVHGINRPVIHTSVHQPVDDKLPGLSLAAFGQYFNRHETWAGMARPWVDYIARNGYLLQQGRHAADVAWFVGEEQPVTAMYAQAPPSGLPVRHGFDFVGADALLRVFGVEGDELVTKSGMRYRVLYLGGSSRRMTLPVLRGIAALVEAGATVIGTAPTDSPSLADDAAEHAALVRRLWSGAAQVRVGRGVVVASADLEGSLAALGIAPDFDYARPQADSEVLFLHRRLADGDLYFVNNRRDRAERIEARFRVRGKAPQVWRADTGTIEPVSYRTEGEVIVVPLEFMAEESYFVVFREPASVPAATVARTALRTVAELAGPWDVTFPADRGAPAMARLASTGSLSEQADPGLRYFSGVSSWSQSFRLPRGVHPGEPLWLDLGRVGDVAEVWVNGSQVGTVWKAPYRLDIAAAVRRGENRLEVRVANLWVNRLIGDAQPNAPKRTFTTLPTYRADAPLRPAGLLGPVLLQSEVPR